MRRLSLLSASLSRDLFRLEEWSVSSLFTEFDIVVASRGTGAVIAKVVQSEQLPHCLQRRAEGLVEEVLRGIVWVGW